MKVRKIKKYLKKSLKYLKNKDFNKALKEYKKVPICYLNSIGLVNRGICYLELGLYPQAIRGFKQSIKIDSRNSYAYHNIGLAYAKLTMYKKAIKNLTKAIYFQYDYANTYCIRGYCYMNLGKYSNAISDLTKAIELNPQYIRAYINRSSAYLCSKQYEKAIDDCTKLNNLDSKSGYHNIGIAYAFLEKYKEALFDFSMVIKIEPKKYHGYFHRGNVYSDLKQYEFAIKDYSNAIELAPTDIVGSIYKIRAQRYKKIRLEAQARADFKKAQELYNPNNKIIIL